MLAAPAPVRPDADRCQHCHVKPAAADVLLPRCRKPRRYCLACTHAVTSARLITFDPYVNVQTLKSRNRKPRHTPLQNLDTLPIDPYSNVPTIASPRTGARRTLNVNPQSNRKQTSMPTTKSTATKSTAKPTTATKKKPATKPNAAAAVKPTQTPLATLEVDMIQTLSTARKFAKLDVATIDKPFLVRTFPKHVKLVDSGLLQYYVADRWGSAHDNDWVSDALIRRIRSAVKKNRNA